MNRKCKEKNEVMNKLINIILALNFNYFWCQINWHVPDTLIPFSEPLKCFNDYETELKCSLFWYEAKSCSENKLNASLKNEIRLVQMMG